MNLPNFAVRSRFLLVCILGAAQVAGVFADPSTDLEALRKKAATKESEQPRQTQGGQHFSAQLRQLQGYISRGEYERAKQLLENVAQYSIAPELQEEWARIANSLKGEIQTMQAAALDTRRIEVDQFVAATKKGCLDAQSSADLDPLLVRCAALQMQQGHQNNVLGERINRKLTGTATFLSTWATYLDSRDAGQATRANEVLRGLRTNGSVFPVLTDEEIGERFVKDVATSLDPRTALVKVFEGVKTPDDLPAAIARLEAYASNPMNPELRILRNEMEQITAIQKAWEALKTGDEKSVLEPLARVANTRDCNVTALYYDALNGQILREVVKRRAEAWTKLSQASDESSIRFLARILNELLVSHDYAKIAEVMKFSDQIPRSAYASSFWKERAALEQFFAAQRFESAGDIVSAVTNYRLVVGLPMGQYVPTVKAQEALTTLQEKYPEIFRNFEGAVFSELRSVRQELMNLQTRSQNMRP